MKVLVRLILVTVMSLGGMSGYSLTVGEDTRVGIQTRQILSNLKSFAGDALGKVDWLKFTSDDEVIIEIYQPVLQACLDEIFLEKEGYHFSQSKWGATAVPFQFRGLEVIGPNELPLNGADKARGIEKRISFNFYLDAHRRFDRKNGWGAWDVENPPNLDGITMVLHAGEWKIASSPRGSYNLK